MARYKPKQRGVGQLLNSPQVAAEMLRRAEVIRSVAVDLSPVGGPGDPHPGQYKASWQARVERRPVGRARKKRPVGIVRNTSYYARWPEYGTEKYPGQHVLLRAAQAGNR